MQWWAINNSTGHNIQYPNSKEAKRILEENIFGVDVKHTATLVSVFGLTTALLDKLSPQEIWNRLKFSDLNEKNIQENNFFDWALTAKNEGWQFDLCIGNPPFNIETGKKKNDVLKPQVLSKLNFKHTDIPNNNFALHFFEGAMPLSKKVCLIIPANVLLYNRAAQGYRNKIFTDFTVISLFDFTHLRRSLFHKTADTPVVAVIAENVPSDRKEIEHTVVKRTLLSEKRLRFEIDYYDRHYVKWNWAVDQTKDFIWKTNLLGGGRLFHLIYRLSLLETLSDYLKDKRKNRSWSYSNGYIGQYGDIVQNEQASFLNNQLRIKPKSFDEFGNFQTEVIPATEYFWNKRDKELFQPPHVIFKLTVEESKIPMAFVDEYLCFNSSFVGISAPDKDRTEIVEIYNRLHKDETLSKLYRTYILSTSPKAVVYHETSIVKADIDNLPYPENKDYLQPTKNESLIIEDVLNYYRHLGKSITPNSAGSILFQNVSQKQLEHFGDVFCDSLNAIYSKVNKSWQPGIIQITDSYIVYQFGFGKNNNLKSEYNESFNEEIETLIEDKISNRGVGYKKIVRFYSYVDGYDCVFLIKPNTIRYWLNSIALRDADDTFIDLKEAGF